MSTTATTTPVETTIDIGLLAHRIAEEYVERQKRGTPTLGRQSLYNDVREAAIVVLDREGVS